MKLARSATGLAALVGLALWMRHRRPHGSRFHHALVTGSSRGLGFAIARELVRRGVAVTVCGRDEATLERARARLAREGRVFATRCDLTRPEQVERMLEEARGALGPIDLLVNNAAIIRVAPLETLSPSDFEEALAVNFLAPLRLILTLLPSLRAQGGHVVNVASVGGRVGVPHLLPYTASKFALTGLSEGLHAELAGRGVGVTTVCPGLTRTGSARHARFGGRPGAEHAWFAFADAVPGLSGDAVRTARRIVEAAESGRADLVTTLPARLAVPLHGLAPGLTAEVLGQAARWLLPGAGAGERARGRATWSSSAPTRAARAAQRDLNQTPGDGPLRTPADAEAAPPEGEAL